MEQKEKPTVNARIITAIEKSRYVIIFSLLALIIIALVIGVVLYLNNSKVTEGLSELDLIEFRYESLDTTADAYESERSKLISEAESLAENSSGVVKVRSLLFVANELFETESFSNARDAYIEAYEADKVAYTAALALFNAAIASEELNEADRALEYFNMVKEYEDFSLMPRVLFNIGRINDSLGNYQEAADMYQEVNDSYPSTNWANISKSRLITLRAENKAE